ncbi:UNVERIFIED_CONTAM: hypothetical protein HDU68_012613 [Siphonaria sp. JEL0065]|nr:hypothetical protein HDU68_012613 [Siphonaria sp. JEL0065]
MSLTSTLDFSLIIHIIGLAAIIVQQSALYDFTIHPIAAQFIPLYAATQLFVFVTTFYIKNKIQSTEKIPLVYAMWAYDTKELDSLLSTHRIMFAVSALSYFQLEFLSSFSLLVLGLLRAVSVAVHPSFRIYVLGKKDVGDLKRPWNSDELFISNVASPKKVEGEEKLDELKGDGENEKKVDAKKSGKGGPKKKE